MRGASKASQLALADAKTEIVRGVLEYPHT
jgi:hypothetical protein